MLDLIKQIDIRIAGILAITMLLITIVSHILIILKILPYKWILGGRCESFKKAKKISMVSIIMLVIIIPFLIISSNLVVISLNQVVSNISNVLLWIMVIMLLINFLMQLLGTKFEKFITSIIVLILLLSVFRIALG